MTHLTKLMLSIGCAAAIPLSAIAQTASRSLTQEALRLMTDGHYYAARLQLEGCDNEGERLICDYFLSTAGTAEKIEAWLRRHPVSPLTTRLQLMLANLQVRDGDYTAALAVYAGQDWRNVPQEERTEALLHQAIAYIHTDNLSGAKQLLGEIENTESHQVDVLYYSGYVRYAEGDYKEALPYFKTIEATYDYRRKAPVYEADCYLHTGRPQEALTLIRTYRQRTGNTELSMEAKRIEGEALYDTKQYYDAIVCLKQYADETQSPRRTALYKLGMSQFLTKDYAHAAPTLSRSSGNGTDVMAQNAWLHAGIAYITTGNKQQARIAFQQASEMTGDTKVQEEALYNYALTLHDGATMGFGESVGVFEQFLNKFPHSKYASSVSRHLSEVYFTTKNYPAALASINKIQNPTGEILSAKQQVLYNLGVQRFISGDFESAKSYMQQSLQAKPNAESYYWKGESEYRLGEYAQAARDLQTYLNASDASQKNRALARYALGYTFFKQKNYAAALPQFRQFTATAQTAIASLGNAGELTADAYNRSGDCLFAQRNYDGAYEAYQQALQTNVSHGDYSLLQQALISGLRGDYTKKVELLNQLGSQYENSQYGADALFEQGRAYVQSGEKQKAMETFRTLVRKYPDSADARRAGNEIGMIYHENGQTAEAIQAYREVLAKYPDTTDAQTALANLKDIYASQGRVDEYAALTQQAGQALSADELDQLTEDAALRAATAGDYALALQHYQKLEAQTQSPQTRLDALVGQLHSARQAHDPQTLINVATRLLQQGSTASPDVQAEARLLRAQTYMSQGNSDAAVADYQVLRQDRQTVYGAQANVELAQYAFDTRQYQSAEDILSEFTASGTAHTYWLARAFVLLSDVYAQTDRQIEARQYLLSLKSNYTESEEINQMIADRLARLN